MPRYRKAINSFSGRERFLSNFWFVKIQYESDVYPSVEHAYQAAKTNVKEERRSIASAETPGKAKRLGRSVHIRPDWEEVKIQIMRQLLIQKFSVPYLRGMLLDTGDAELIEGNNWGDTFWGMCQGRGENMLGKLLMEVRAGIL